MVTTTAEAPRTQPAAVPAAPAPWYRNRQRQLMAGLILLVVVALVAWFMAASNQRKEEFAARSLNQARAAAEAGNLPLASSELQRLISAYRGTDAASEAVITLNQVRMINGQSELAAVGLREFLDDNPAEQYQTPAYGLLGAALENSRRWVEAGNAFLQASNRAEVEYLKAKYLVDAGRAFKLGGRNEEAAKAYRTVLQRYPDSPSLTEAKVRLAELTGGRM